MIAEGLQPVHPGEILKEEFLKPLGISQAELARQIGVSAGLISRIVKCKSPVTADVALRLGRFFSVSPQFWLNMQSRYDLEKAKEILGSRLEEEVRVFTK